MKKVLTLHSRQVTIGGLIILGTIFSGPFFQNGINHKIQTFSQDTEKLLQTPGQTFGEYDGLLPVANRYEAYTRADDRGDAEFFEPSPWMVATVKSGWFYWLSSKDIQGTSLPVTCSTGNCTWTNTTTLGVASRCVRATSEVRTTADARTWGISEQANVTNVDLVNGRLIYRKLRIHSSTSIPSGSVFRSRRDDLPLLVHVGVIFRSRRVHTVLGRDGVRQLLRTW
jgi:hypothetical protein